MTHKRIRKSDVEASGSLETINDPGLIALMKDISDFTPKKWAWICAQTAHAEQDYEPTATLIEGL